MSSISGISNYMNMDDEFAYLYSVQYGIDLSFLALHRAFPALVPQGSAAAPAAAMPGVLAILLPGQGAIDGQRH